VKRYLVAGVLVLLTASVTRAEEGGRQLTLKEAVKLAVENNLDVKAELYNPASAEADVYKFQGIYDPVLSLLANYQDSSTLQPNSVITGGQSVNRQRSTNLNAGVSRLLSSGATVGASFDNSWNHNNFGGFAINNYFQSDVTLKLTQPLLKNSGQETTELAINVAKFNKEGALEQFRAKLTDIVFQVRTQYFQLYSARENLKVRKTSLDLAEKILTDTQARVKAGVLPAMEILNARFGVATQQKNLIDAERALSDEVDALRLLLQIRDTADIIPVDTPFRDDYTVDTAVAIRQATAERPELRQLRVTEQTAELQSRVARNQTLPQLDLTASAAFSGLGTTYSRDLERVSSGQYPVWGAGLQLTYPIGNDGARNDYVKSRLRVDQSRVQVRSLEESVANEVRTAARAVRSGYLQLDVTARGREYAQEVLQAFIKKQQVGLATTKDVQDELNNLVTAQGNEIQALADYNKAITTLWKATAELLPREGIFLNDREADALYRAQR
jgi:outer membrane protein TolC